MQVLVCCCVPDYPNRVVKNTIYYSAVLMGVSNTVALRTWLELWSSVSMSKRLTPMAGSRPPLTRLLSGAQGGAIDGHIFMWPFYMDWASHSMVAIPGLVLNQVWKDMQIWKWLSGRKKFIFTLDSWKCHIGPSKKYWGHSGGRKGREENMLLLGFL